MTVPIVGQDEAEGDGCCINKTEELDFWQNQKNAFIASSSCFKYQHSLVI
jgi:hypothetical protein